MEKEDEILDIDWPRWGFLAKFIWWLFAYYLPILDINVSFNFAGYIEKPMELLWKSPSTGLFKAFTFILVWGTMDHILLYIIYNGLVKSTLIESNSGKSLTLTIISTKIHHNARQLELLMAN